MEFFKSKMVTTGWAVLTGLILAVVVIQGASGCSPISMDFGSSEYAKLDTVAHTPLANVSSWGMTHCMQVCARTSTCNFVNYEKVDKTCLLFDIPDIAGMTKSYAATWLAISLVRLTTVPKFLYECEPNQCEAGKRCVEYSAVGPVCATLQLF